MTLSKQGFESSRIERTTQKVCNNNEKKSLLVIKTRKNMKKVKILVASVLFCAMGYVGYTAHKGMTMSEVEEFMKANIEALTLNEPGGGGEVVKCYCRHNWIWPNVCSAEGDGRYCGGDPCSNHDGNCR